MEKTKKKKIWIPILAAVVVLGAAAGIVFGSGMLNKPEEPAGGDEEILASLYWNVNGTSYIDENTGLSVRPANADGFYYIDFATTNNRKVTKKISNNMLLNKIDRQRCMILVQDDNGNITDIKTLADIGWDYVYDRYYCQETTSDGFILNSSPNYSGLEEELKLDGSYPLIDVSGFDSASPAGTQLKELRAEDKVVGVMNEKEELKSIYVVERQMISEVLERYCDHCKEVVKWKGWTVENDLPYTKSHYTHYYLTTDVTMKIRAPFAENTNICLDLNGHKVLGAMNHRIYFMNKPNSSLSIFDYSKEQTGIIQAQGTHSDGGGLMIVNKSEFNLYGGTLDGTGFEAQGVGGVLYIGKEGTFRQYGGKITNGHAKANEYKKENKQQVRGGVGGNIILYGLYEMYDGEVSNGYAEKLVYTKADGTTATTGGTSGNMYITTGGVFKMYGGVFKDGVADRTGGNIQMYKGARMELYDGALITGGKTKDKNNNGGNVYQVADSEIVMNGGVISNGSTPGFGGNLYVNSATFTMNGGEIKGGLAYENATKEVVPSETGSCNVFIVKSKNFTMAGGYIAGGVRVVKQDTPAIVNFTGTAKIYGNKLNLTVSDPMYIHAQGLQNGAKISVTAEDYFTDTVDAREAAYFVSDVPNTNVCHYDGKLFIGDLRCTCGGTLKDGQDGHKCANVPFKAWASTNTLPTKNGNFYLTDNVNCKGQNNVAKDATVCLDLNGFTVNGSKDRRIYCVLSEGGNLSICDSKGTGRMISNMADENKKSAYYQGGLIYVNYGMLTLYGGTFDASKVYGNKSGSCIMTAKTAKGVTMYGGTIIGGTTESVASPNSKGKYETDGGNGGSLYINDNNVFNFYSGTIKGGQTKSTSYKDGDATKYTAAMGGNIHSGGAHTTINMGGMEGLPAPILEGGKSDGGAGNIYSVGKFNFYSGIIKDGEAGLNPNAPNKNGGNVYAGGDFLLSGGEILNGRGSAYAANVAAYGNVTLKSGRIQGGKTTSEETGALRSQNIFFVGTNGKGSVLDIQGATVDGDLYVNGTATDKVVKMSGDPKITKGSFEKGLYLPNDVDIQLGTLGDASVVITTTAEFTTKSNPGDEKKFISSDSKMKVERDEDTGVLSVVSNEPSHIHCICGGKSEGATAANGHTCNEKQKWIAISDIDDLGAAGSGYYYLNADCTMDTQVNINGGKDIVLCLNGKTVTMKKRFMVGATTAGKLTITDCCETPGTLKVDKSVTFAQSIVYMHNYSTVTLYNGILDASEMVTTTDNSTAVYVGSVTQAVLDQGNTGNFTMYGGTVKGVDLEANKLTTDGACVKVGGLRTMTLYGGLLTGGVSEKGAVTTMSSSKLNLFGGEISGNTGLGLSLQGTTTLNNKVIIKDNKNAKGEQANLYTAKVMTALPTLSKDSEIGLNVSSEGTVMTLTAPSSGDVEALKELKSVLKPDNTDNSIQADSKDLVISFNLKNDIHRHCVCGGVENATLKNGHTCDAKQVWTGIGDIDELANKSSGYYYLTADCTMDTQININGGKDIVLCLNGKTVTMKKRFMVGASTAGKLTITDCRETCGTMKADKSVTTAQCLIYMHNFSTVTIYNGHFDASEMKTTTANSAVIYMGSVNKDNSAGNLTMYGGKITGIDLNTNKATGASAVLLGGYRTFTLYGGKITCGVSDTGAIYSSQTTSQLNLFGGEVVGNTGALAGINTTGNITVDNKVIVRNNDKTAGGDAANIICPNPILALPTLDPKSEIGITKAAGQTAMTLTAEKAEDVETLKALVSVLKPDDPDTSVKAEAKDLTISFNMVAEAHKHCVCGGNSKGATAANGHTCDATTVWKPLDSISGLATLASGYYYLTQDVEFSGQINIAGRDLVICFNGHTINAGIVGKGAGRFLIGNTAAGSLTFTDCKKTCGGFKAVKTLKFNQCLFYMHKNSSITIYNGKFDMTDALFLDATKSNCMIYIGSAGDTVNIYDGELIGADCSACTAAFSTGGIMVGSGTTLNLYEGVIKNGKAPKGGNIYVKGGTVNMKGGVVTGGTATTGGGVYVESGTWNKTGGEVSGNTATTDPQIHLPK